MFDKLKDFWGMQKKMQEIKRELEGTNFEIESSDGLVKITMNGAQKVEMVTVKSDLTDKEKERLGETLKDTFNKAIKRSQEIAAQKMREKVGFNIPGLS